MTKIVALSLIAAASLTLAACKKEAAPVENNTAVVDNAVEAPADANAVAPDATLAPTKPPPAAVTLDGAYKLVDALDALIPSPPSLVGCRSLRVRGAVKFAEGVVLEGDVLVANDAGGSYFRPLGHRFDGEAQHAAPGRARQLGDEFDRIWERARPCAELRALGL